MTDDRTCPICRGAEWIENNAFTYPCPSCNPDSDEFEDEDDEEDEVLSFPRLLKTLSPGQSVNYIVSQMAPGIGCTDARPCPPMGMLLDAKIVMCSNKLPFGQEGADLMGLSLGPDPEGRVFVMNHCPFCGTDYRKTVKNYAQGDTLDMSKTTTDFPGGLPL